MTLKTEITVSDIFAGISLILVIIGGIFAYYQWRRNVSLKRASYINGRYSYNFPCGLSVRAKR